MTVCETPVSLLFLPYLFLSGIDVSPKCKQIKGATTYTVVRPASSTGVSLQKKYYVIICHLVLLFLYDLFDMMRDLDGYLQLDSLLIS